MSFQAYKGTATAPTTGALPVRQAVTAPGFTPQAVLFFSASTNALDSSQAAILECIGAATHDGQFAVSNGSDAAVATSNAGRISRTTECVCLPSNGTPAIDALARRVSLGGDGFVLEWTDLPAAASVLHYLALGGDDLLNASIVSVVPTTTTNGATQAVVLGFPPDFLLFVSPAVGSSTGIVDANMCVGVAARASGGKYTAFWFENDATTTRDCAVYSTTGRAMSLPGSTAVKDADFTISSWDANGFTITWDDAPATLTPQLFVLALQGGQYQINALQTPTATGTQGVSTSFPARAVLTFGSSDATDSDTTASSTTTDSAFMIGAADNGLRQGVNSFLQQDANATSFAKRRTSSSKVVSGMTGTAGSLLAEAALSAVGPSSYTLNWTTANPTQRRFCAVAFGDNAIQNPFIFNTPQAPT